jgi:hypothetical protein
MGQVTPAPVDVCATAEDDDCSGSNMPCTNDPLWAHTAASEIIPPVVAVDPMGNVVLVGGFGGVVDWGFGPISAPNGNAIGIVRFNTSGTQLWSKVYGGMQSRGFSAAIDSAGNILAGGRLDGVFDFGGGPLGVAGQTSCVVIKLSPAGGHLWSRSSPCAGSYAGNPGVGLIATDAANNVFLAGQELETINFGSGPLPHSQGGTDIWVVKLDANGNQLWGKDFGLDFSSPMGTLSSIATTPGGNVIVAGLNPNLDFGGGKVTGRMFILELLANGSYGWSKGITAADGTEGPRIAVDSAGNILVGGDFKGSIDLGFGSQSAQNGIFMSKRDGAGAPLWGKVYPGNSAIFRVAAGPTGIFFAGLFEGSIDFGSGPLMTLSPSDSDGFLTRLDSAGKVVSTKVIGGAGSQVFLSFGLTASNNVVATGEYVGTIDFGGGAGPITNSVNSETFLAKFVP